MKTAIIVALCLSCMTGPQFTLLSAEGGPASPRAQRDEAACVLFWAETPYRYPGYDHVVHLHNTCRARADCRVWTDVDREPIPVVVESGEHTEVIVRIASPARTFVPHAACDIDPKK